MTLIEAVGDQLRRTAIAKDAVARAEAVIRARTGLSATAAQFGLDAINTLRPGFLVRQIDELLPALAGALEPHWNEGLARGNPGQHLEQNAQHIADELLLVTDSHAAAAVDRTAIAVYRRLRVFAPARVAEQMPHIAAFVAAHSDR